MAHIEIDAAAMQQLQIFLLKGLVTVMLLLPGDLAADCFAVGRADAECAIAFLPCKATIAGLVMNPLRGDGLDISNHIGETGGGVQAKEQVNMIGHAADCLGNGA
jgi:hypothetical protein